VDGLELFSQCNYSLFRSAQIRSLIAGIQSYADSPAQTIFADNTYSKPFFLTYLNTSCFVLPLLAILLARVFKLWRLKKLSQVTSLKSLLQHLDLGDPLQAEEQEQAILYHRAATADGEDGVEDDVRATDLGTQREVVVKQNESGKLGLKGTAKLSLQFCILWVSVLENT